MEKQEIAIVFLCAGISSRFGGNLKQFAQVGPNGETLIEVSINQALKAGFSKIVFIVGNKTEIPFREKFGNSYKGIPIEYALQKYDEKERDKPWGTIEAISTIWPVDSSVVVCNGDDIYGEKSFRILVEHIKREKNVDAVIGYRLDDALPERGKANRGLIIADKDGDVERMQEVYNISKENYAATNSNPNSLCNMNIFALNPRTIDLLRLAVDRFKESHKGDRKTECILVDVLGDLAKEKKVKMKIYSTDEKWVGITNPGDEVKVREELKKGLGGVRF